MHGEETAQARVLTDGMNEALVPVATPLYPSSHNAPKCSVGLTTRYLVEGSGRRVRVRALCSTHNKRKGGGTRSPVTGFSRQSRKQMMLACAAISWSQVPVERCFFVEVTHYYTTAAPSHPKECLAKLHKRLTSYLGSDGFSTIWKQEFKADSTWHAHLLLVVWRLPRSLAKEWNMARDDRLPSGFLERMQGWIARTWCSIVGLKNRDDEAHRLWYCERAQSVEGVLNYMRKGPGEHNMKRHQAMLPGSVSGAGRWWGLWGSRLLPRDRDFLEISAEQFHDARRLVRKEMEKHPEKGYSPHIYSSVSGMDVVAGGEEGAFRDELFEYLRHVRPAA